MCNFVKALFLCANMGHFSSLFEKKGDIETKLWPLPDGSKPEEKELVDNKVCWAAASEASGQLA